MDIKRDVNLPDHVKACDSDTKVYFQLPKVEATTSEMENESETDVYEENVISTTREEDEQRKNGSFEISLTEPPVKDADDVKIVKYQFNDVYLSFIHKFTAFCERKPELLFDSSIFFDETFFPKYLSLNDFVPINVVLPDLEKLEICIPVDYEYGQCTGFYQTNMDELEINIRTQICFILNSIQCPRITNFKIEDFAAELDTQSYFPEDRLSTCNLSISRFISRHSKTLNNISLEFMRRKVEARSEEKTVKLNSSKKHPKLEELVVSLCTMETFFYQPDSKDSGDNLSNAWIPDEADRYLVTLARSQVHGFLQKLSWTSPTILDWDYVFRPVFDNNENSLENVCILEVDVEGTQIGPGFSSSSRTVLNCSIFAKLRKLKTLSLRKINCNLTGLNMIPKQVQELAIEDMYINSDEISSLAGLELKALTLYNIIPPIVNQDGEGIIPVTYGVDRCCLKDLLSIRTLSQLSICGHRLDLDIDSLSGQRGFSLNALLHKVNDYLLNTCRSFRSKSREEFSKGHTKWTTEDKELFQALRAVGYLDNEFFVIHADED